MVRVREREREREKERERESTVAFTVEFFGDLVYGWL